MSDPYRPYDVRRANRRRVLAGIRRAGSISRTELSAHTGLSPATVSAITADLLAEGIVAAADAEPEPGARGRPKIGLGVSAGAGRVAAMSFQLDLVEATVIDYAGGIAATARRYLDTLAADPEAVRQGLRAVLSDALQKAGPGPALGRISAAVQGIADVGGRVLVWSPVTPGKNLPIADWLEADFGVPVQIANDCDAMALALHWREPERYGQNFAAVLLAHGVGMGLFLRGGVINGTVSSGMELGHMPHLPNGALCRCGRRGCVEAYAGDYAIERRALGQPEDSTPRAFGHVPDIAAIAARARSGNVDARAALAAAGQAIGHGLASIYALVDPFPVVLIGHGTLAFDLMEPSLRAMLGGGMGGTQAAAVAIDTVDEVQPLLREGCAIAALQELDAELAGAVSGNGMPLKRGHG